MMTFIVLLYNLLYHHNPVHDAKLILVFLEHGICKNKIHLIENIITFLFEVLIFKPQLKTL